MKFLLILVLIPNALARPMMTQTIAGATGHHDAVSRAGRDLPLFQFESAQAQHRIYLQAALHGNETGTTDFALWLIKRLRADEGPLAAKKQFAFDIVPVASPDGYITKNRLNGHLVNLNRNFSVLWGLSRESPGLAPFSEPETQAIRRLFQKNRYSAAIDIHGFINWIVTPSVHPGKAQARGSVQELVRLRTAAEVATQRFDPSYKLKSASSLGDGGAFEDWAFWEMGVPAICFELDQGLPNRLRYLEYEMFIADFLDLVTMREIAARSTPRARASH